ncbi:MAG: YggS family pyridoxal phosphate-dependent enzyme [Oscillospiraceae bacterium]|nr:YggS family pyridoxal phosphate-dependent enzyme [Oscillospiraceae bacterium]
MSIAENIALIRANIARAAREAGREPSEILLIGASKMNDAAACRAAIAAGVDALGENRVQEMTQKLAENAYEGAPLHFIGHLQRNKVKQVVGKVDVIESVGSMELLTMIDAQAEKLRICQDILLEVNIGGEDAKSGFAPQDIPDAARAAAALNHVRVRGLMCIPPVAEEKHGSVPYFEKVHGLYVDINEKMYHNKLDMLSMGMSDDYEDAVRCGATIVRVGTAIFGARNYTV